MEGPEPSEIEVFLEQSESEAKVVETGNDDLKNLQSKMSNADNKPNQLSSEGKGSSSEASSEQDLSPSIEVILIYVVK